MSLRVCVLLLCTINGSITFCNVSEPDCVTILDVEYHRVKHTWTSARYPVWTQTTLLSLSLILWFMLGSMLNRPGTSTFVKLFPNLTLGDDVCELIKRPPDPGGQFYTLFNKPSNHCYPIFFVTRAKGREKGIYMFVEESDQENFVTEHLNVKRFKNGIAVKISDNITRIIDDHAVEFHLVEISAKDLKKKIRYFYLFPTRVSLKNHFAVHSIVTLFSQACVLLFTFPKLIVDALDVFIDVEYATELDNGTVISSNITRNSVANDLILAFAIVGGFKFFLFAFGTYTILHLRKKDKAKKIVLQPIVSCVKIFCEDFVELFLEYFFVDIYTTEFNDQLHLVVSKIFFTLIGHAIPGLKLLFTFSKNYKKVKSNSDQEIRLKAPKMFRNCKALYFDMNIKIAKLLELYLVCTIVKILFSFIVVFRIIGVIQHMVQSFAIPKQCFVVEDGRLLQNPFNLGCLGFVNIVIISLYVITICFIPICFVVNMTIVPCLKKIQSLFHKKFNCSRFYYQNQFTKIPVENIHGDRLKWRVKTKDELNEKQSHGLSFKIKKQFSKETSL